MLEVHLTNRLSEPTSVHWHGLRVPAPMDGTDMVQAPVAPGTSFTNRFRLTDAGTFWYHPHSNETVQLERGLYGALIVRGDNEAALDGEQVLVFDDLKLDKQGQLAKFGGFVQTHDGREGDRVELAVGPFEEGDILAVESLAYWRSTFKRRRTKPFATLHVGPAKPSHAKLPAPLRTIAPLASATTPATRVVDFGVKVSLKRGMEFVVNDEVHHRDAPVKVGELQVWDIVNSSLMDHPFHLHGFSFQVLAVNGQPTPWLSWEDVVNLPPKSTTKIAWMPDDRPGSWMYHCHILEHHAAGMMAHFDVVR